MLKSFDRDCYEWSRRIILYFHSYSLYEGKTYSRNKYLYIIYKIWLFGRNYAENAILKETVEEICSKTL